MSCDMFSDFLNACDEDTAFGALMKLQHCIGEDKSTETQNTYTLGNGKVVVEICEESDGGDTDGMSLDELLAYCEELEELVDEIESEEPEDEFSEAYEEWEERLDEAQDELDDVLSIIEQMQEETEE